MSFYQRPRPIKGRFISYILERLEDVNLVIGQLSQLIEIPGWHDEMVA